MATIAQVKISLDPPITSTTFDDYFTSLLEAAALDLGIAGVDLPTTLDAICDRAEITYCAYHWEMDHGSTDRAEKLKVSYDEQKAQLSMATGYTDWSMIND